MAKGKVYNQDKYWQPAGEGTATQAGHLAPHS